MVIELNIDKEDFSEIIKYEKRAINNCKIIDAIWEYDGYTLDLVDRISGLSAAYLLFDYTEIGLAMMDEFYDDMHSGDMSVEEIVEKYWPLFEMSSNWNQQVNEIE